VNLTDLKLETVLGFIITRLAIKNSLFYANIWPWNGD